MDWITVADHRAGRRHAGGREGETKMMHRASIKQIADELRCRANFYDDLSRKQKEAGNELHFRGYRNAYNDALKMITGQRMYFMTVKEWFGTNPADPMTKGGKVLKCQRMKRSQHRSKRKS